MYCDYCEQANEIMGRVPDCKNCDFYKHVILPKTEEEYDDSSWIMMN